MAGYDFDFNTPNRFRDETRAWIHFVQRLCRASRSGLEVTFRSLAEGRRVRVHVNVDGPLPAMQFLRMELRNQATSYVLARGNSVSFVSEVLGPFLAENDKGVRGISANVFNIAKSLRARGASVKVAPFAMSPVLLRHSERRAPSSREGKSIRHVAQAISAWNSGNASSEQAVIAVDQALEAWLKARCGIPPEDRIGFPSVLDKGVEFGLLTRKESSSLRLHHARRNAVQHRGAMITRANVRRAVALAISIMNRATA